LFIGISVFSPNDADKKVIAWTCPYCGYNNIPWSYDYSMGERMRDSQKRKT